MKEHTEEKESAEDKDSVMDPMHIKEATVRFLLYKMDQAGTQLSKDLEDRFAGVPPGTEAESQYRWVEEEVARAAEEVARLAREGSVREAISGPLPRAVVGIVTLAGAQVHAFGKRLGLS